MPSKNHMPAPTVLVHAMVTLAMLWSWPSIAALVALGFVALLRPGELAALRVRNFVFSGDFHETEWYFFVTIESPKMRRRGSRLEHVRVRSRVLYVFLRALFAGIPSEAKIFPGKPTELARALDALLAFFGIEGGDGAGITWASLRTGGATSLYRADTPLDAIKWRGRWHAWATLDRYIQEVASLSPLSRLNPAGRLRVETFAASVQQALNIAPHWLTRTRPF